MLPCITLSPQVKFLHNTYKFYRLWILSGYMMIYTQSVFPNNVGPTIRIVEHYKKLQKNNRIRLFLVQFLCSQGKNHPFTTYCLVKCFFGLVKVQVYRTYCPVKF